MGNKWLKCLHQHSHLYCLFLLVLYLKIKDIVWVFIIKQNKVSYKYTHAHHNRGQCIPTTIIKALYNTVNTQITRPRTWHIFFQIQTLFLNNWLEGKFPIFIFPFQVFLRQVGMAGFQFVVAHKAPLAGPAQCYIALGTNVVRLHGPA